MPSQKIGRRQEKEALKWSNTTTVCFVVQEMVEWLGHKPVRVTYSSDYFGQLFELAKELIRRDKAFICHQTQEEVRSRFLFH